MTIPAMGTEQAAPFVNVEMRFAAVAAGGKDYARAMQRRSFNDIDLSPLSGSQWYIVKDQRSGMDGKLMLGKSSERRRGVDPGEK